MASAGSYAERVALGAQAGCCGGVLPEPRVESLPRR